MSAFKIVLFLDVVEKNNMLPWLILLNGKNCSQLSFIFLLSSYALLSQATMCFCTIFWDKFVSVLSKSLNHSNKKLMEEDGDGDIFCVFCICIFLSVCFVFVMFICVFFICIFCICMFCICF